VYNTPQPKSCLSEALAGSSLETATRCLIPSTDRNASASATAAAHNDGRLHSAVWPSRAVAISAEGGCTAARTRAVRGVGAARRGHAAVAVEVADPVDTAAVGGEKRRGKNRSR